MKITIIITALLFALPWPSLAQSGTALPINREISLSEQQTTSLLFPYPIASVDRGSQDVLAQKPKGIENLLQLKAAQQEFTPSNLTVITTDGKLYNFQVCYAAEPDCYAFDFTTKESRPDVTFSAISDADRIDALASKAYHDRHRISLREGNYGITLSITGMFIADDHLFYRVLIENGTNISYDLDQIRFMIKDQRRSRRTASQEVELQPVKFWMVPTKIPAQGMKSFVVVLPKFTIPNKKNLIVQLIENNGGKHLELSIRQQRLDKPIPLL